VIAVGSKPYELQKELKQRTGAMSDCMFVTEPAVQ
jgi:hypothetical protein